MGVGACVSDLCFICLFVYLFVITVLRAASLTHFFTLWKRHHTEELYWEGTTLPCSLILCPAGEVGV